MRGRGYIYGFIFEEAYLRRDLLAEFEGFLKQLFVRAPHGRCFHCFQKGSTVYYLTLAGHLKLE